MKERLIELINLLNCTTSQFANAIGVQRATLQHILNGRNEPSLKIIMAVHESFPQVDLEWLLYGKGNTFGETSPREPQNNDYPLFPGIENAITVPQGKDLRDFSNVRDQREAALTRKRADNKGHNSTTGTSQESSHNRIKEVVVFFEDGTYQKITSELKK